VTMTHRHHHSIPFLVVLLALVTISLPVSAADWPQFRGPNRDGKSAETGLLAQWPAEGPRLLWTATGVGAGFSHVSVADGLIYVTGLVGKEGILQALTPDGTVKWRVSYGPEYSDAHPGARTIPTVHDGLVYVASGLGNVSCFEAATGTPVWSVKVFEQYEAPPVQWGYAESLLVDGDNVIVTPCGKQATMVALNRKTGAAVWASPALEQASSFCSPLLVERGGQRLLITMTEVAVLAFSAADGKLVWQHPYQNARQNHPDMPLYQDGLLYVTSGYGKGAIGLAIAEDGGSVTPVWEQKKQDPCHGQAVLVDGYVYASSHQSASGRWTCVDLQSGRLAWEDPGVGKGGSVIYADGRLYCYTEDGTVGLLRPSAEKCEILGSFKVPQGDGSHWAHPVVANGRLYVRHGEALMCYDIAAK